MGEPIRLAETICPKCDYKNSGYDDTGQHSGGMGDFYHTSATRQDKELTGVIMISVCPNCDHIFIE